MLGQQEAGAGGQVVAVPRGGQIPDGAVEMPAGMRVVSRSPVGQGPTLRCQPGLVSALSGAGAAGPDLWAHAGSHTHRWWRRRGARARLGSRCRWMWTATLSQWEVRRQDRCAREVRPSARRRSRERGSTGIAWPLARATGLQTPSRATARARRGSQSTRSARPDRVNTEPPPSLSGTARDAAAAPAQVGHLVAMLPYAFCILAIAVIIVLCVVGRSVPHAPLRDETLVRTREVTTTNRSIVACPMCPSAPLCGHRPCAAAGAAPALDLTRGARRQDEPDGLCRVQLVLPRWKDGEPSLLPSRPPDPRTAPRRPLSRATPVPKELGPSASRPCRLRRACSPGVAASCRLITSRRPRALYSPSHNPPSPPQLACFDPRGSPAAWRRGVAATPRRRQRACARAWYAPPRG